MADQRFILQVHKSISLLSTGLLGSASLNSLQLAIKVVSARNGVSATSFRSITSGTSQTSVRGALKTEPVCKDTRLWLLEQDECLENCGRLYISRVECHQKADWFHTT